MENVAIKVLELNSFQDDSSEITQIIQRLLKYQAELGPIILDHYSDPDSQFITVTVDMEQIEPFWLKFLDLDRFVNGDLPVFCCEECGCHYSSCNRIYPFTYRGNNGVVGRSYECEVCRIFDRKTTQEIRDRNEKDGPHAAKRHALSLLEEPQQNHAISDKVTQEDNLFEASSTPIFNQAISVDRIPTILSILANNAWNGESPQSLVFTDGKHMVKLEGYVYEPGYEYFSATSSLTLDGEILYGYDSRNVAAYQNETYQIGVYADLDDAISALKKQIGGHTLYRNSLDIKISDATGRNSSCNGLCERKNSDFER